MPLGGDVANRADADIISGVGFSTAVLLLAFAHAGVGLAAARSATSFRAAAVRALAVAGGSTVVVSLVWRGQAPWFDLFALAHVAYLGLVVTVPAMAAVALLARQRTPLPHLRTRSVGIVLVIGLLPAAVGVYATHLEPQWLRTDRHTIRLSGAGVDAAPALRIAVMADVQNTQIDDHELAALRRVNDAKPDLLLVAGDLWAQGLTRDERPKFQAYVRSMVAAATTVVIVEGDSDNSRGLLALAEGTGAVVLVDETLDIEVNGRQVRIAGLSLRERPAVGAQRTAIDQLQAASPDAITILLSHRPDAIYDLTEPVDLVVAGHTHGGQFALPLVGPLFTLSSVPRHVAAGGLHEVDGQAIYVSTGIGMERSHAPQLRFGARPSIGVIDVIAASGAGS